MTNAKFHSKKRKRPRTTDDGARERGVVLLMVLWVITILSVMALEFSSAMRTEVNLTKNFQDEVQLYALAEGGVERAIAELVYKLDPRIQQIRRALKPEEIPPDKKEWMTDGKENQLQFPQGICEVRVFGEGGKVNINLVSESTLRKIISHMGFAAEVADTVTDSILDWRDPDDLHRINGAENEHYQALKEPYQAKNGNLDTVEEMLLIRGVTPEIFYGKRGAKKEEDRIGLKDIFTIYSPGEQIDINSAAFPVLKVVLGLPPDIARLIIRARQEKEFEGQQDLLQRVPDMASLFSEMGQRITFRSPAPYYTIEARASKKGREAARNIKAIVKIDPREREGRKIVQWLDFFV